MDEALELGDYLPISYRAQSEGEYVGFLWSAFESNYSAGKYEFASLAFHLLYMSFVSFSIWQIRTARQRDFKFALVGFQNESEADLLAADAPAPNNLLNYGYSIMRAAVARALVAAGLLPMLGIHHSNRSNAFCLADDLLEPLRPIVDRRVRELFIDFKRTELDRATKAGLLELLTRTVNTSGETGPLFVAIHRYVASLVKCFQGEANNLAIPILPGD